MKYGLIIVGLVPIAFGILLTSCLKKIDAADNLTTNIFDKEYTGDCWFDVVDCYSFQNQVGQTRIRVEAVLYESKMPGLKPSAVNIKCKVNDQEELLLYVITNEDGDYPFYYDAIPETFNEYCIEAGLYLVAEDSTINRFTICTQP